MSTYIGYYRATDGFAQENTERARRQGATMDEKFGRMVVELPGKLPHGVNIIGSYAPMAGTALPSVIIVDADDTSGLAFISNYYAGYQTFQWAPATVVGASRGQREAWEAAQASPVAAVR